MDQVPVRRGHGEDAMHQINVIAAIAAGILGYFPGGLWYSKAMFLHRWARESGIDIDTQPAGGLGPRIAIGVATSIVAAIVFALIAGPAPGLCHALLLGLACGRLIAAAFSIQLDSICVRSPQPGFLGDQCRLSYRAICPVRAGYRTVAMKTHSRPGSQRAFPLGEVVAKSAGQRPRRLVGIRV